MKGLGDKELMMMPMLSEALSVVNATATNRSRPRALPLPWTMRARLRPVELTGSFDGKLDRKKAIPSPLTRAVSRNSGPGAKCKMRP